MSSSWTILLGFLTVAAAAFWYDARNEASAATSPAQDAAMVSHVP